VKITFNSRGRKNRQYKTVTVSVNDPERPTTTLSIKGLVIMALELDPSTVQFGEIFKGESRTLEAKVIPRRGMEFEIDSVESPGFPFEAEVLPGPGLGQAVKNAIFSAKENIAERFGSRDSSANAEKPATPTADEYMDMEKARLISVKILPDAPVGRHSETLKIHTNVEEKPLLELRIVANVFGNIKIEPQSHNFGSFKRGEAKEAIFKITLSKTGTAKVTGVETTSEYVLAEVCQSVPGPGYDLKVRISPESPPARLNGYVTVHTTDEEQPELVVKFFANVTE
jgi:hypothetical protein